MTKPHLISDFILKSDVTKILNEALKPYFSNQTGMKNEDKALIISTLHEYCKAVKAEVTKVNEPLSWTKVNV